MANTKLFVEVTGKILSVKCDVTCGTMVLSRKVRIILGDDVMYDVSFPQEDWTCVDEDTGIRSITAPTLFSNMVIGNILTIGGVEQKDPAINGIGWLTARRIGYVNGVRTELKRVAVIDNGKFRKGKRKEIAVVESNKRRVYAKSSNTTDTSSTSTYSAPARPNFLG